MEHLGAAALQLRLRQAGIQPTLQRLAVAAVLMPQPVHRTADQVLHEARALQPDISRATVYAVLQLFVRQGLLKELPVDGAATVYDSNLLPHHHLYHEDTGEITDLPAESVQLTGLPSLGLGLGLEMMGIDVIVRVRSSSTGAGG